MDEEERNNPTPPEEEAGEQNQQGTPEGENPPPAEGENPPAEGESSPAEEEGASGGDGSSFSYDDNGSPEGENKPEGEEEKYNSKLMGEVRNRRLIFNQLTSLRSILEDISRLSDTLFYKKRTIDPHVDIPKNTWRNISYVNRTAEEKIEQISIILSGDAITQLSIEKLRKIFLALQRISKALIEILERAEENLKEK